MKNHFIKIIYVIVMLYVFVTCLQCKNNHSISTAKTEFSISLSTFNHAELLFTGIMTYEIKNDSFLITEQSSFEPIKDTLLFSKKIESSFVEQIMDMRLDTLKDLYFNNCVMATSGQEYWISINKDTITKSIQLHHFYHKQVEELIRIINKTVSDKYKINYLASDINQDCKY